MKRKLRSLLSLALALVLAAALTLPASAAMRIEHNVTALTEHRDLSNGNVSVLTKFSEKLAADPVRVSTNSEGLSRREAVRAITISVLGVEDAVALPLPTTPPFDDVPIDDPDAKYIEYCKNEGIIDGHGNGLFDPEGELTDTAFAKMMLGSLGYNSALEGYTGTAWEQNVTVAALGVGLFVLVDEDGEPVNSSDKIGEILTADESARSFHDFLADDRRDELEQFFKNCNADASAVSGTEAAGMLMATATLPHVTYDDAATDTAPTVTYVFNIDVSSASVPTEPTDGETATEHLTDGLVIRVTTSLPAEVLDAPSFGGARYVTEGTGEPLPEGKAVGLSMNDRKTVYLTEEEAETLLELLDELSPEDVMAFLQFFHGTAVRDDGTTADFLPEEMMEGIDPDQGLVDALSDVVATALTSTVEVGANVYDPTVDTIVNRYLGSDVAWEVGGSDWTFRTGSDVTHGLSRVSSYSPRASGRYRFGSDPSGDVYGSVARIDSSKISLKMGFTSGLKHVVSNDAFGRPVGTWKLGDMNFAEYVNGQTYTCTEPLTYKELFDQLGAGTVDNMRSIEHYVDGVLTEGSITPALLSGSSSDTIPGTGHGVLTEVYVTDGLDSAAITVVSINTYLALFDGIDSESVYLTPDVDGKRAAHTVNGLIDADLIEPISGCSVGDKLLVTLTRNADGGVDELHSLAPAPTEEMTLTAEFDSTKNVISFDGEQYALSHNADIARATLDAKYEVCFDGCGNVLDIEKLEQLTMTHLAVAQIKDDDGALTLSGRWITDDDVELKRDGETITLKDTYTAYPWAGGVAVPDECVLIPSAPADIVDSLPADVEGERVIGAMLSPLGEVSAAPATVDLPAFFEEHPNTAGWIYVVTLFSNEDGDAVQLAVYEQPIAYPLVGSSDAPVELPSEDDECCSVENDYADCDCTCTTMPGDTVYCGHETCWCYYEVGPGASDYGEDAATDTGSTPSTEE